jgi:hypothetical protein
MKRSVPLAVVFAIALTIVALLPLYIERTMTHVMFADGSGGAIEWGWKRCTLRSYWADYHHMSREQEPAMWLGVNLALALGYAAIAVVPLNLAIRRWCSRDR